jgi:opacity protein-like surface antigen
MLTNARRTVRPIAAALALAATALPAAAADLGRPYSPPRREAYEPVRTFDHTPWTGAYIGLSIGRAWGSTAVEEPGGNLTFDTNGNMFGAYAGYAVQSGQFVIGGEVDISTGNLRGSSLLVGSNVSSELSWLAAGRVRAGVLLSPALYVYGMAGVAWASFELGAHGFTRSDDFVGFQLGAGSELRITQSLGLRLDYVYTGFGSEKRDFPGFQDRFEPDMHAVRAGLSFRF